MKNRTVITCMMAIALGIIAPVIGGTSIIHAASNGVQPRTTVDNKSTGNILTDESGNTSTPLGNNRFRIVEGIKTFDEEFFIDANIVRINGQDYILSEYISALNNDDFSATKALATISPMPFINTSLTNLRIEPRAVLPTSGYYAMGLVTTRKKINMVLALSTAALTAIAAFLTGGVSLAKDFVKGVIKKGISAGVIAAGTDHMTTTAYYDLYQAMHKTVYGAVKEMRKPFIKIGSIKLYETSYTYYYWSVRPSN